MIDYYNMKALDPYERYDDEDPFEGIPLRTEDSINKIKLRKGAITYPLRLRQESADSLTKNI